MKKCLNCNIEFTPVSNRGNEQKYCSVKCRNKAGSKRYVEKIINTNNNGNNDNGNNGRKFSESMDSSQWRVSQTTSGDRFISDSIEPYGNKSRDIERYNFKGEFGINQESHISIIKELYEAKNETIFYKLKCESLEKEIIELKLELEEIDNEEDGQYSGMLGGVMEQFKQDPVNTINFASELIQTLFKPKP